ncbi:receptor-type tyrosine-protein phosphatase H-like [Fundulus diaphanus]
MKILSFKTASDHLLLGVVFSLLWVVAECRATSEPASIKMAEPMTAKQNVNVQNLRIVAPPDTESFKAIAQTETTITLQWTKVGGINSYTLSYDGKEVNITLSAVNVEYTVSGLSSATRYSFTLYTVSEGVRSRGVNISAVTAPPDTESFKAIAQTETTITLQWTKVGGINSYTLSYDGKEVNITLSAVNVEYTVSGLSSATRYSFTLYTVSEGVRSRGVNISAVTAPPDTKSFKAITQTETTITLQWTKVGGINSYTLSYDGKEVNITLSAVNGEYTVSGLTSATRYSFTLYTVFDYVRSRGVNISAVTAPRDTKSFKAVTQTETTITLQWTKVGDINNYTLYYDGKEVNITLSAVNVEYTVSGLTNATRYSFTLYTVFEGVRSRGANISAVTAPPDTKSFKAIAQNKTTITLQWTKVGDINSYTLSYDGKEVNITHSAENVEYTVSGLTSATRYSFTLYTVSEGVRSRGANISAVTAPPDTESFKAIAQTETTITLQWTKVGNIDNYTLSYDGNEVNITLSAVNGEYTVSGLTNATRYSFTLYTVLEGVRSRGVNISAVTAPPDTESFKAVTQTETTITLQWTKVGDINSYTLSYDGKEVNITHSAENVEYTVSGLTSATRYSFTLYTVFDYARSRGANISAVTAPPDTESFKAIAQNETTITLEWIKVGDINSYTLSYDGKEVNITLSAVNVEYTVSGLTSATRYSFTLYTVLEGARSRGANISAVTAPEKPAEFTSMGQTETSITLRWKQARNVQNYTVSFNEMMINVTTSNETVTHIVSGLESGVNYDFWLFSVFDYARSSGANLTAPTVPPEVPSVNVAERLVERFTLQWKDLNKGWKYLLHVADRNETITPKNSENTVSFTVSDLKPGRKYSFSIITMFSGLRSTPYRGVTVTKIDCSSVNWKVTNSSIKGTVEGLFSKATASNDSAAHFSPAGKDVSFTNLYPGATYEVLLEYELLSKLYPQCSINIPIIPPSLTGHCSYYSSGYGAVIRWDPPHGVLTAVTVNINGQNHPVEGKKNEHTVSGLQPAKRYEVALISELVTEFGDRSSEPSVFLCLTDNRGVIAGAVVGVLLFCVLICVIVFIVRKRPEIIRRKKSFLSGSKMSDSKGKIIPVAKFPDHFHQLGLDENRGFSQEYESLAPVGTDQLRKAATLPENKVKNRFTNILPYDWSRVKLNTSSPNDVLDYINANYIPGYSSSREYIASQGPLPSTVSDFWRMVWEQKVKRIVMVTNCTESGRTKCEQYWPDDSKPCRYGELMISKTSEDRQPNWTLREFRVKHTSDSEERTVKHFHFTSWPDHGVPQGTEVLIHFRGLVRNHIESEGSKAPTVVHCSAGVGRTGTIIALDVLLQQLEQERAVGISNFVYKMRQHRSHMVQTESQYVFLHQCIMDSLQPPATQEENIYENDLIYVNATALRQLR